MTRLVPHDGGGHRAGRTRDGQRRRVAFARVVDELRVVAHDVVVGRRARPARLVQLSRLVLTLKCTQREARFTLEYKLNAAAS